MPKFLEEIQLKSLSAVTSPRDGVSIYNSGGALKVLYPDGTEHTLLTGSVDGIDLSNYYTKLETDKAISDALADIAPGGFEVVIGKPTTGESGKLYLELNTDGTYSEYLYINNKWELVGSTDVDFSNYYTKDEVDELLENLPTGGSNVSANPDLIGNEEKLESITINGTNYKLEGENISITEATVEGAKIIGNIQLGNENWTIPTPEANVDTSNLATKKEVSDAISGLKTEILNGVSTEFDTLKEVESWITDSESGALAMANQIGEISTELQLKANTADVYNKTQVDNLIANVGGGSTGGSTVIANPELDGGEEVLESIQIEDTKYTLQGQDMTFSESVSTDPEAKILKTITIGTDDWKVDKGSVVTPNVELTGDEPVLESVQIDDNTFTLKGEEMIFSETAVEGATILRNIQLGDDNWAIPEGGSGGSNVSVNQELTGTEDDLVSLTVEGVTYSVMGDEITFSEDSKSGYSLKSITVGDTVWSIEGGNYATESYVDNKVADLVNSAPSTLDTLGELATALQENQGVVETLDSAITNKLDKSSIVYSETEPTNPVLGMIWLKPAQ